MKWLWYSLQNLEKGFIRTNMHTTVLTEETKIFCSEEFCYFSMAILRWGYFFAIWMVNILAFKSLKATVFTKASLGTIHIWRHHPLGGRKNCWRIDIKKCWHTGGSGQRKGKKLWRHICTVPYELFCYYKTPMTNPSFSQNFEASSSYFWVNIGVLKFGLSEKHTKICAIFLMHCTST